ncbi:lysosomal proton-coupled steroid conjugate and bile acid symporter SLC46A3-like [Anticarsia gemmatalis]|uniref:lysosomal proton-coupled steroid conjugate and bile acid symporter SLC46A3-like n=1 Tax=Anticarsia gemmatalis TaxID=129554 RepID=UPI003F75E45A
MSNEDRVYNYNHTEPTEEQPLNEAGEVKDEEEPRTFREKISDVISNVTVEPSLLLFIISNMVLITASQNLYLEKACRVNLNFTDEICDSLKTQDADSQNMYEREVQKLIAKAMMWKTYLSATIPCILALFAGSFSDRTGHRKFFMVIAMFGQFLIGINNILNVYFFNDIGLEVLVLSEGIIEGLSGGWCLCFLTAFAYISTITSDKNRTYRMGLMSFSITVAFPIGIGMSGIWLKKFGYYGSYGLTTTLHFLNIMYVFFVIKDPKRNKEQKKHDRQGCCHLVRTFFDISNVKETISVIVKKTPDNRRVRLCILLLVVSVLFGPMYGEISVMYMSTRYRFGWDEVKYSLFQTYNFVTHTIGTIFSVMVFSKYLQWHDSLLGIVSTLSKIAASFVYCFAPNERIFYIAPAVEILNGTSLLAMRSIISKLVEVNELGKVNSMVGLVENLMPLIYVPLYTKTYTATMEVLPGAVFLLGASMTLPAVIVLSWLFYDHRKQLRKSRATQEE